MTSKPITLASAYLWSLWQDEKKKKAKATEAMKELRQAIKRLRQ